MRTSSATVAPILRARSRRYGFTSVMTHVARAGMLADRNGHAADRPGAGDEHIFADQIERESGVDGVA